MIFLEILQGFKFYWNICIDCCTFCYKKVSSTETRDGAINSVQPTRNGCEDVCHSFRSGRNATQQQDISTPEDLLHAGASDGCFSAGCQMATLPHPPQVRSQFWFSQKKIVDSLTLFSVLTNVQVLQFKNWPDLLAHGHSHHRVTQVWRGHGVGPHRHWRLVRVEVFYARTVQPTFLNSLTDILFFSRNYYRH